MRKILFLSLLIVGIVSCQEPREYKYIIHNDSKSTTYYIFNDTLEFSGDSVGYHNTDGSYVLISDKSLLDCKIDTLK